MIPAAPAFICAPVIELVSDPLDIFLRINVGLFGLFVLCVCVAVWVADDREAGR